jgi:hypothetical protein
VERQQQVRQQCWQLSTQQRHLVAAVLLWQGRHLQMLLVGTTQPITVLPGAGRWEMSWEEEHHPRHHKQPQSLQEAAGQQ